MRILLISPMPPPAGGMAIWTKLYTEYMTRYNNIDLVNTGVIGKRANKYSERSASEEIKRFVLIAVKTLKFLLNKKYDVVHFNTSCSGLGMLRDHFLIGMICIFNKRIVLHCHCNLRYAVNSEKKKKYFDKMLRRSKKCITLNNDSARFIADNYMMQSLTVPNFIDESYKDILETDKTIAPEIKKVLYVGHLLHTKGCDNIIRIARKFPNIEFRLVGHIFEEIGSMPKTENVILTGELDKNGVAMEYEQADLVLFPTHTEGFPLVAVEGMSYGLPFITTKVGAIEDIFENEGAVYVPVDDDSAIETALRDLIHNAEKRKAMSLFNKNKVKSSYYIDKVLDDIQKIYEETVNE